MKLVFDMDFFVVYEMFMRVLITIIAFNVFGWWFVSDGIKVALVIFFGLWVLIPALKLGMVWRERDRED